MWTAILGDIGGTNLRLYLQEINSSPELKLKGKILKEVKYNTQEFACFEDALEKFLEVSIED